MNEILTFVPPLLAVAGALATLWKTVTKYRTRADLSTELQSNAADIVELRKQINEKDQLRGADLAAATAVVQKYAERLSSKAERNEAEAALGQPSASGRADYIREVAAEKS
jgi:hypothetical protein